jgi:PAS domain S-box-containing protein
LRWAVGSFCAFAGALALVVPHHFEPPPYAALQPHLGWWGLAAALAGGSLLAVASIPVPRQIGVASHLLAAFVLMALGGALALTGTWTAFAIYAPLSVATAIAGGLREGERDPATPRRDLFALAMALGGVLTGVMLLAAPQQFGAPQYALVRPFLTWIGVGMLAGGSALAWGQLAPRIPRAAVVGINLLGGMALLAFGLTMVVPVRAWLGIAVFGGGGAIVAVLPWIGDRLRTPRTASLRTVLALALVLGVVAPVVLLVAIVGERAEDAETHQALDAQQALARVLAEDVASYISLHQATLGLLAQRSGLLEMPQDRQLATVSTVAAAYPEFRSLAIADAEGNALARTTPSTLPFTGYPFFDDAARTNAQSLQFLISPTIFRPTFAFASPIRGDGGEFMGAVIGVIESTRIVDLLARARPGPGTTAFLVNAEGRVIAHPDRSLMESFADLTGWRPVGQLVAGGPSEGSVVYEGPSGVSLAAFARVPELGWGVVIERTKAAALVASRTEREGIFGVVLLVAGLITALAVVIAGRIVGPLSALASAAGELAAGNPLAPLPTSGVREIGQLSDAFGQMRVELAERSAQLGTRYEEIRVLHEFGQLALASDDPQDIVDTVLERAMELGQYGIGTVHLKDERGRLKLAAARGYRDHGNQNPYVTREPIGLAGTDVMEEVQTGDRFRDLKAEGVQSAVVVPMVVEGETIGTLRFGSRAPRKFQSQEIGVLEAIGSQLGVVVQKATLLQATQGAYTELKASEEGRARLAAIIEATPDLVAIGTSSGRRLYINPAGRAMLSIPPDEDLTSGRFGDARPEWARTLLFREAIPHAELHGAWTGEMAYLSRDGREIPVSAVILAHRGVDGEIAFYSTIARDLTALKQAEERLRRSQRLEAAGLVAGQVAHDFNNLLGPLMGFPELIKMRLSEGDPAAGFCDVMIEAARQMAELNADLLALGRRAHVEYEATDLNALVKEALVSFEREPTRITVRVELAADLLPVRGSAAQLLRVVNNLISNAREAMQDAGELVVRTENVYVDEPTGGFARVGPGQYVLLEVTDTGPGIPPEIRDRIFDPFFSTRRSGPRRGAGLGLSVVQSVVDDHQGHVGVLSEVGRGTTFRVYLPTSRDGVKEKAASIVATGTETVLVVDDDELQRTVAAEMLGSLGYRVSTAAGGEEAVDLVRERPADLLVLDMVMPPGIDGVETYRRVLEVRPGQRALILSGFAESERVDEALALGAGRFLRKPVSLAQLAQAVRTELDRGVT